MKPFVDDKGKTHYYTLDASGNRIKTFTKLSGDKKNPGYHNLYALDGALYNSFSKFNNNDVDVTIPSIKIMAWTALFVCIHRDIVICTVINILWSFLSDASNAYNDLFPTGQLVSA